MLEATQKKPDLSQYKLGLKKPTEKWQPDDHEQEVIKDFDCTFEIASRYRSVYEDQWKENIERYRAQPFYHEDGRAGVVLPIAKWIIESKQATEMKSPPSFSYQPLNYKEDEQVAKILESIVKDHVWHLKHVDLDTKLDVGNQDKDILGGIYFYVGWKKIFRTIRKPKRGGGIKLDSDVDKKEAALKLGDFSVTQELYYDDICVEKIFPQDVWLHPLALSVADSPWVFIRKRFDYDSFLEEFSNTDFYKNLQFVPKGKWAMPTSSDDDIAYKDYTVDEKDQVVVFEKWDKLRDLVVIRANGVLIYEGPNPYEDKELPYVDLIDRLQFNTYVGEGEPQRIATIADAINKFVNLALDKETLSATGLNLVDNNLSDFDDISTLFTPRQATYVSDPKNTFNHIDIPGMSSSTDRVISMLMDYLIFATGVDFRQITDLNTSTQATVAAIRREITQGRLNLNVRRNENRGIKRLGWLLAKRVQQYYPIPLVEHLSGNDPEGEDGENTEGGPLNKTPEKPTAQKPIQYRRIKVTGQEIEEKPEIGPGGKSIYTTNSLVRKNVGENDYGFFEARPAYIRTKGDIEVKVIAESTFAASRELEKANAKEYVEMAGAAVETDPATGASKPILSLLYGLQMYVKAMGYDEKKAFDTENKSMTTPAQDEAQKLMGGAMGGQPGAPQPPAGGGVPSLQGGVPPQPKQATLTGANSEPVQQLKADLAAQNNITQ